MRYRISQSDNGTLDVYMVTYPSIRPVEGFMQLPTDSEVFHGALDGRAALHDINKIYIQDMFPPLRAIIDSTPPSSDIDELIGGTNVSLDALLKGNVVFTYTLSHEHGSSYGPFRMVKRHEGPPAMVKVCAEPPAQSECQAESDITIKAAIDLLCDPQAGDCAGTLLTLLRSKLQGNASVKAILLDRMASMPVAMLNDVLKALSTGVETTEDLELLIKALDIKID